MTQLDSLQLVQLNQKYIELSNKTDSISELFKHSQIKESYFSDILSHQWVLLSIQTAIFVMIILIIVTAAGYFSWRVFFRRIVIKNKELQNNFENIPEILDELKMTTNRASRALYESAERKGWRIVWHIRYIDWFVNNYKDDDRKDEFRNGIIQRCKNLSNEYDILVKDNEEYEWFKKFANKDGLIKTLKKLIDTEIPEIMKIVLRIFGDLQ